MDENSSPSRKFLNLLKKMTKQFSLIKQQKYVFFNIAKLQIWFLTSICCNTFLNMFYCQAYISDTSNECNNNLSSVVQLTPTSVIKENKRTYSVTTTKQQRKKIQKTLFKVFFFFSIYLKYWLSSSLNLCFIHFMDNSGC